MDGGDEYGLAYDDDPPSYHPGERSQTREYRNQSVASSSASHSQYRSAHSSITSSRNDSQPSLLSSLQDNPDAIGFNRLRISDPTPTDAGSMSSNFDYIDSRPRQQHLSHPDGSSDYSSHSNMWHPRGGEPADIAGSYNVGDTGYHVPSNHSNHDPAQSYSGQISQRGSGQHGNFNSNYDPLYAAASSVLGGPPPDPSSQSPYIQASPPVSTYSIESHRAGLPHNPYPPNRNPTVSSNFSTYTAPASLQYQPTPSNGIVDRPPSPASIRPSLLRANTTFEAMPSTRKTKAIDVNHPPYTRKYVEEYRTRIKGDPDPESHFRYAKYLIDAAKKIGADAADQKAVRKYRDSLIVESLKVIRRLATQGETFPEAQFFLANCHGTGMLGLQIDHERAYHLYLQAAKQNHPSSAYRVAVCNEIGAGTRRDSSRAFAFYRKAASLGDTPAMFKLGMILLSGSLGQTKNPREAIGWLKRAAEQADEENPHALHELGLLHEMPNSNIVMHDDAYAKELFTRAANLGYTQAQFKLGQSYEFGSPSCPIDPRRSVGWYTKAAEKGDPEAELALSGWYLTGSEGVLKQSDSEAYLWARRAATKGLSKAEYAVGYYAEVGIGVKQDPELAKRWYMRAAAQGNKRAMQRLTEMKREGNKKRTAARPTRQQANKDECIII